MNTEIPIPQTINSEMVAEIDSLQRKLEAAIQSCHRQERQIDKQQRDIEKLERYLDIICTLIEER